MFIGIVQKKARQEKIAKMKSSKKQKTKSTDLTLTQMVAATNKDNETEVQAVNIYSYRLVT
jgi:hypothetical protein